MNHLANFNQTWHNSSLGEGGSILLKWRAPPFLQGEIITKLQKYVHWQIKKDSPEPLNLFQPNLAEIIFGCRGFEVQMKGSALFHGG